VSRSVRQGFLWVGLAAVVFGLATLAPAPRAGAQETKMRLGVPSGEITVGGAPFTVDVLVENVVNLGAFEFTLGYDASVLEFVSVEKGDFLASSGRRVECLDPRVSPGSVRLVCVTLGATPPGPDGSAVLATLTFTPAAAGTSPLRFDKGILARPDGQRISATNENASITVTLPGARQTPSPAGASPVPTAAQLTPAAATPTAITPTAATSVAPTPTLVGTPVTTTSSGNSGTNWALWGSVIGAAAVLVVAAAGTLWWSRIRKPS
jgi:hypothetical protein